VDQLTTLTDQENAGGLVRITNQGLGWPIANDRSLSDHVAPKLKNKTRQMQ
jgi:hypothetical protein